MWRLADGLRSISTIASTLARRHGLPLPSTEAAVRALAADLAARGLLHGTAARERPRSEYELLGVRSAVIADDPKVLALLDRLQSQLRPRGSREPDVIYDVSRVDGGLRIRSRGSTLRDVSTPLDAAMALEWLMADEAMERDRSRVHFHASAIAGRRASILMPAGHRAGKTTLALAARQRGLRLYSDDVVALDPGTWRPVPVPRSVHVEDDGLARLRRIGLADPRGHRVGSYLEAAFLSPWPRAPGPAVRHVVLPRPSGERGSRLKPSATAEVAAELLGCSRDLQRTHGFGTRLVRGLFADVRCWKLLAGTDLAEAAALLAGLTE